MGGGGSVLQNLMGGGGGGLSLYMGGALGDLLKMNFFARIFEEF